MGRIKKGSATQGKVVKSLAPINYDLQPPVFSLEKIQPGKYCLFNLDQANKAMFAYAIYRRKSLSWNEIKQAPKHGLGTEKISTNSITAAKPKFITEDLSDYLAFRYNGKQPMVGYRQRDVFFVLWFDHDFTLYNH
jgi:hypothetical protein